MSQSGIATNVAKTNMHGTINIADFVQMISIQQIYLKFWICCVLGILTGLSILRMPVIKVGFRTIEVNLAVGGESESYHIKGGAADIHIAGQDDTAEALADTVLIAAEAYGLEGQLGIGYYSDGWIHIDTRGYTWRW